MCRTKIILIHEGTDISTGEVPAAWKTYIFGRLYLFTIATQGIIRRYVAIDHDGLINEMTKPNVETTGVIRDLYTPFKASRLLILTDVISGVLVRYHQ